MFGGITFAGATFAGVVGILGPLPAVPTNIGIVIGGIEVTARVRVQGVTIRDVLNDAPNTANLTIEGDAPAVGQPVTITIGSRLLFAGAIQTIDQAFESIPAHVAWHLTAIDDTGLANARRPFGTFVDNYSWSIAETIAAQFAPGFATTGISHSLPPITITFDGSETFIACLARIATAVGGYCKIENRTIYLYRTDPGTPPDPIDASHRFLINPPITLNTDVSQLRTRVYGKGYGENVPTDVAANETLVPIQDGAMFPALGGTAIVGLTADGAQSDRIAFTGVSRPVGGTLVGTGAAPANAPTLGLAAGGVVTNGVHQVAVVHVTGSGKSLAGPSGSINVNPLTPPATAPTANPATNGTGPDQGSHDYVVTYQMLGGETTPDKISNAVTTSAALGQVASPSNFFATVSLVPGKLPSVNAQTYYATFTNAQGETEGGSPVPVSAPGLPQRAMGVCTFVQVQTGGGLTGGTGRNYFYWLSFLTADGYETAIDDSYVQVTVGAGYGTVQLQYLKTNSPGLNVDPRIVKRRLYRSLSDGMPNPTFAVGGYLLAEINNNAENVIYTDTASDASISGHETYFVAGGWGPSGPRGPDPGYQMNLSNIPVGPAGVTGRKLYRKPSTQTVARYLATIPNNTQTTYTDNIADSALVVDMPTSNTSGTAVQKIPLTAIPIGPVGVTGRALYRRFNGAGTFKLVTVLANNTATTYTDGTPNGGLGVAAPTTNTATGNTISVSGIPTGAGAVTARELYMTTAGGTALHLAQTIADNVTTTATLNLADAALTGAAPPATDTSGLQQPQGQVNPGAATLVVASPSPFASSGGWVTTGGGQVVRYTGISGQLLTGIPASGPGAITTTILYGQQAIPTPTLTGVTGLQRLIRKGSAVAIWVQRDDTLAQSEHAARTGTDGVVEYLIVDGRRGVDSLTARCDADLKLFSRPILTVQYATRDMKTASGKTVTINLVKPAIVATMIIQEVTITELDIAPHLPPRFTVKASTVRFSLEDTLRRLIAGGVTAIND